MPPGIYPRPSPEARFWPKVDKNGPLWNGTPCWVWLGGKNNKDGEKGYGVFSVSKSVIAHRFAYELLVGPIPHDLTIDHLCRNRACVNPTHLEPVTMRINVLRGNGITSKFARKAHCPLGHPYTILNTWFNSRGGRYCRECHRIRRRKGFSMKAEAPQV